MEELRRRIEDLENRRLGDVEEDLDSKDNIEEERNAEEGDPTLHLISFMKDRGSARMEFSCYDGSLNFKTLID